MNNMTSKFIRNTIVKVIIFALLMSIVLVLAQSVSPVVSNNLALGQMQDSDEAFVIMNIYDKVRPCFNAAKVGIVIWFAIAIAKDIYKFVKIIKTTEKEKEN